MWWQNVKSNVGIKGAEIVGKEKKTLYLVYCRRPVMPFRKSVDNKNNSEIPSTVTLNLNVHDIYAMETLEQSCPNRILYLGHPSASTEGSIHPAVCCGVSGGPRYSRSAVLLLYGHHYPRHPHPRDRYSIVV